MIKFLRYFRNTFYIRFSSRAIPLIIEKQTLNAKKGTLTRVSFVKVPVFFIATHNVTRSMFKTSAVFRNIHQSYIYMQSAISTNNDGLQRSRRYRSWERMRGNGTPIRTPMTHTSSVVQCGRNPHAEDASAREYLPKWLLALRRSTPKTVQSFGDVSFP